MIILKMRDYRSFYPKYYNCLMKKVLLVTRVSGFIPQHEMKHVRILQDMGYEVHYASDFNNVVYGKDNHRLDGTGVIRHQIDFVKSPFSRQVKKSYLQLVKLLMEEEFAMIHCHMPMSGVVGRLAAQKVYRQTDVMCRYYIRHMVCISIPERRFAIGCIIRWSIFWHVIRIG